MRNQQFDSAVFAGIFIAGCAFTATRVDGLIPKLWFLYLAASVLIGAAWFYKHEKKTEKQQEDQP